MKNKFIKYYKEFGLQNFILEGVTYDNNNNEFVFNFDNDGELDILKLKKLELEPIDVYDNTYYYGYDFTEDVDSVIRTKFINAIKFNTLFEQTSDFNKFVYNAILNLNRTIELPEFNTIVFPETQSNLNRKMISEISNLTYINNYTTLELIKDIPKNINFNYDKFNTDELSKIDKNGYPVYTKHAKIQILKNIEKMIENIRNSDYFSIARSIKKDKYRKYFENFLKFKSDIEKQKYLEISKDNNILLLDDVTTSGTTLYEMLKILRSLNNKNKIVIFTLVGKKFTIN